MYTFEACPEQWAEIQKGLATAHQNIVQGDRSVNLERITNHYANALQVYTSEDFPKEWADVQFKLGVAYYECICGKKVVNLEQSLTCFKNTLQVYTFETNPQEWATAKALLGSVYCIRSTISTTYKVTTVPNLCSKLRFNCDRLKKRVLKRYLGRYTPNERKPEASAANISQVP